MAISVTTDADVKKLIDTNRDTSPFIAVASTVITENLATSGLSDAAKSNIFLYLAAHFVCITEEIGGLQESRIGGLAGTSERYRTQDPKAVGFATTRFGMTALSLDTSGTLAAMGANNGLKALFSVIKYPPFDSLSGEPL
jgi:hypothetical protein